MRWSRPRSAGKDVTVVVELRARFDEEANIELANRLQEAGAQVVYGVVGYKTHAKMLLIVRRESGGLRRYVPPRHRQLPPRTARIYTDFGLITADEEIGEDVHELFLQLTSLDADAAAASSLLQSPFTLHDGAARRRSSAKSRTRAPASRRASSPR